MCFIYCSVPDFRVKETIIHSPLTHRWHYELLTFRRTTTAPITKRAFTQRSVDIKIWKIQQKNTYEYIFKIFGAHFIKNEFFFNLKQCSNLGIMVQVVRYYSHYSISYGQLKKYTWRRWARIIVNAYLIRVKVARFTQRFTYLKLYLIIWLPILFLKFKLRVNVWFYVFKTIKVKEICF